MGKRGPARTPTPILDIRGSWRAKERKGEVVHEIKRPRCPQWLPAEAKRVWRRVAPILEKQGLISEHHREMLAGYCEACADFRNAVEWLKANPATFTTTTGYRSSAPEVKIRDRALQRMRQFSALFGFSPSDQVGLSATGDEQPEDVIVPFRKTS